MLRGALGDAEATSIGHIHAHGLGTQECDRCDARVIAAENPVDPTTWKWTSADLLFLRLLKAAHARGLRVIVDYSFNHTGTTFWAWRDLVENQRDSRRHVRMCLCDTH